MVTVAALVQLAIVMVWVMLLPVLIAGVTEHPVTVKSVPTSPVIASLNTSV